MPMKISDRDLMIAEEYLRRSYDRGMTNHHDAPRARDVLQHILDQAIEMRAFQRKTVAEHEARLNAAVINRL